MAGDSSPAPEGPQSSVTDYRKQFAEDCARYVATFPGLRVLVVGCGAGLDCQYFVSFGATVVHGIDPDDHIGSDFRHSSLTYLNGVAEAMPFKDYSYDVVYSVATMEHVHDIQRAFTEIVRVTKREGLIYCVAAPLWNSREGHHHFGLFPDYPWIHLRLSKHGIVKYCRERGISKPGHDVSDDVDFMFSHYFNRLPARRYLEACGCLPVSRLIENSLWFEPEDHLPEDLFVELRGHGYTKEELLAVSHKFVARK